MIFDWAIVVACVLMQIKLDLGVQIVDEGRYFYARERSSDMT